MAEVETLFYHAIRQQLRRVLGKMTEEQIDAGLTAFEDGSRNWSQCFFARALRPHVLHSEYDVVRILGLESPMPVRILYTMFDQAHGSRMTSSELYQFLASVRDESRPDEVNKLLRSMNWKNSEAPLPMFEVTCA